MVCCGQNGIAHLGQNGIMMAHCIGLKKIKMQCVLSSYAYNISLTLFSRCTSLIVITSKEPVCPRVELIFKIIIILLIIFLGFIKSKPC